VTSRAQSLDGEGGAAEALADADEDATEEAATQDESESGTRRKRRRRQLGQRPFPPTPFEEALELPSAIQRLASGQRVRRLRLFELLERSPDSSTSRALITSSARYNLTTGSYGAEWLELTPQGRQATSENVPEREKIRARYSLAIDQFAPFKKLHEQFVNNRLPAKSVMADVLREDGLGEEDVSECVDIFLLNAKFIGILQNLSGAERLVPLDYVLDYAPAGVQAVPPTQPGARQAVVLTEPVPAVLAPSDGRQWDRVCFYITPIGAEGSEERQHSDLFLGSIIEPALEEFGLDVVRADRIEEAGMIGRQVVEHILRSRLVIADLSFHNPNVFYELALRHASGLPTVQIIRTSDRLPFDVNQVRTIQIDTSSIYSLVPQLEVYRSAITSQVRRALESPETVDSPVSPYRSFFTRE
jgi:hypothetical protein